MRKIPNVCFNVEKKCSLTNQEHGMNVLWGLSGRDRPKLVLGFTQSLRRTLPSACSKNKGPKFNLLANLLHYFLHGQGWTNVEASEGGNASWKSDTKGKELTNPGSQALTWRSCPWCRRFPAVLRVSPFSNTNPVPLSISAWFISRKQQPLPPKQDAPNMYKS